MVLKNIIVGLFLFFVCTNVNGQSSEYTSLLKNQSSLFEENKGQIQGSESGNVKFVYNSNGISVFLLNNRIAYQFNKTYYPSGFKHLEVNASEEEHLKMMALEKQIHTETYRMDLELVGAKLNNSITTEGKSSDFINYNNYQVFDVHSYSKVIYHNVYPSIDWVIYIVDNNLKYDFVVHPGGDPKMIKLKTHAVENISLGSDGALNLKSRMGTIIEERPVSFQGKAAIKTAFTLTDNIVSFNVDTYNKKEDLIIDPLVRFWGTYYGGTGYDYGRSCTVDANGDIYICGTSTSTTNIATLGSYDATYGGNTDGFIAKFNPQGQRLWATYYGGTGKEELNDCKLDSNGNLIICGQSQSSTNIATVGSFDETYAGGVSGFGGGGDSYVAKFNSNGSLIWATYYGNTGQEYSYSCAVDASNNIYLTGSTFSTTGIATVGSFDETFGGHYDSFLVKFDSNGLRQWATYIGGTQLDEVLSSSIDPLGNIYIGGYTKSTTGIASTGSYDETFTSGMYELDAYLLKFDANGVRLWGTYYGGAHYDMAYMTATDSEGNVYLGGNTESDTAISTSNGYDQTYFDGFDTYDDAFLVKFNADGDRLWGTYYGGEFDDSFRKAKIDGEGNIFLIGTTNSTTEIATAGCYDVSLGGNTDAFVVKFSSNGTLRWGTYYGGDFSSGNEVAEEKGYDCAIAEDGSLYIIGETFSYVDIGTQGSFLENYAGNYDAFFAKLESCQSTTAVLDVTSCSSYLWTLNGQTYTASGNYLYTLTNVEGCDSTVTLNLIITQPSSYQDNQTVCDSLTWIDGNTYYVSTNTPTFTLTNAAGCDSIVTLNLTIIPSVPTIVENTFSLPSDPNNCVGEFAVDISGNEDFELSINNGLQTATSAGYSLFTGLCPGVHDLQIVNSCGDTTTSQFVIPVDSNYVFNNPFIDSLAQDSLGTTIEDCDIYYAGIDTAYIDSIWATGNTVNVIWNIVDSNGSNLDTTTYELNNGNGVYWLQLSVFCPTKALGDYFTVTESIYFEDGDISTAGINDWEETNVLIYPNPTNNLVTISFEGNEAELVIYDAHGKLIKMPQEINSGSQISIKDVQTGVYFFEIATLEGKVVKRVVRN